VTTQFSRAWVEQAFRRVPLCRETARGYKGCRGYSTYPWRPFFLGFQPFFLPQSDNKSRWTAVAAQDFATPGTDRVRQEVATPGLQIPLEQQYGDLLLASAQIRFTAFDIVALKFLQIEALRAEYQNPLMEH
jgi:hypothetical protein